VLQEFIPQMTRYYVQDPDFFFLAIRLLDRFFRTHTALDHAESILARIPRFTAQNTEFVEWATLDSCLGAVFRGGDNHEHLSGLMAWASPAEKNAFLMDQGALEVISQIGAVLLRQVVLLKFLALACQIPKFIS